MATFENPDAADEQAMVLGLIWRMLKGQWSIERHDFTDVALNGQNIPLGCINVPSPGFCKMVPCASSDPGYDEEILKSSVVHYYTRSNKSDGELIDSQGEKYAFRRKNGKWSLWDVPGGPNNPAYVKMADFTLKRFREEWIGQYRTFDVVLEALPWTDEFGRNYFQMGFVLGKTLRWELRCRFDDHPTGTVRQWLDVCTFIETHWSDEEKQHQLKLMDNVKKEEEG